VGVITVGVVVWALEHPENLASAWALNTPNLENDYSRLENIR